MRESGEMAGATDLPCVFISFRQFGHRVPKETGAPQRWQCMPEIVEAVSTSRYSIRPSRNPLFDLPERNMEMFCNFIFIYSVGADIIPHIPRKAVLPDKWDIAFLHNVLEACVRKIHSIYIYRKYFFSVSIVVTLHCYLLVTIITTEPCFFNQLRKDNRSVEYQLQRENPIAVFDSGVGGISVLRELIRIMPEEDFIYFGDSKKCTIRNKKKRKSAGTDDRMCTKAVFDQGQKVLWTIYYGNLIDTFIFHSYHFFHIITLLCNSKVIFTCAP